MCQHAMHFSCKRRGITVYQVSLCFLTEISTELHIYANQERSCANSVQVRKVSYAEIN